MIPCQQCGQPATVHLTNITNKKKVETHLCAECAQKQKLFGDGDAPQLNLEALVQITMNQPTAADPTTLACPNCGLKYAAFRADGRLGCARDYEAFRVNLEPLLERIHHATGHTGKVPRMATRQATLNLLKEKLEAAVASERYEDAAQLRDQIRQKEGDR